MTRPELNEDFIDVLAAFAEHGVELIVVGAHALAAHGIVRATGDIALFVRCSRLRFRRAEVEAATERGRAALNRVGAWAAACARCSGYVTKHEAAVV